MMALLLLLLPLLLLLLLLLLPLLITTTTTDRGEVAHDGVEVAEHLDGGQLAHPHEGLNLEEDLEAARAPGQD